MLILRVLLSEGVNIEMTPKDGKAFSRYGRVHTPLVINLVGHEIDEIIVLPTHVILFIFVKVIRNRAF